MVDVLLPACSSQLNIIFRFLFRLFSGVANVVWLRIFLVGYVYIYIYIKRVP